jgi:hypothetical protein
MSQYLNAHVRQDFFSWLLPLCYRNPPTQAHPAQYRLLRFLVFLFRYMLLGLVSLVNRASLNQRAVGSTPKPPTKNQLNSEALAGKLPAGVITVFEWYESSLFAAWRRSASETEISSRCPRLRETMPGARSNGIPSIAVR